METFILKKLTATDIGILIVAICYLIDKMFSLFFKLREYIKKEQTTEQRVPVMPDECSKILHSIQKTTMEINNRFVDMERSSDKRDSDSVKSWYTQKSIHDGVRDINQKLDTIMIALKGK